MFGTAFHLRRRLFGRAMGRIAWDGTGIFLRVTLLHFFSKSFLFQLLLSQERVDLAVPEYLDLFVREGTLDAIWVESQVIISFDVLFD
jgi:hypothetical protein